MAPVLALLWGLTATEFACWIIGIAAIVAIVTIALRAFNLTPPPWVMQVVWVVVIAFVCIGAVVLISSIMRGA